MSLPTPFYDQDGIKIFCGEVFKPYRGFARNGGNAGAINMSEQIETLGTALPKEIERCQELLTHYAEIGPVGQFGAMMIKQDIANAHKAMMEGDCVAMLRAYEQLKGCN